jgi:hypothetical protein
MTPCIHVLRMPCSRDVKWVRVKLTLLVEYKFCQSFTSTNNLDELEILMQGYWELYASGLAADHKVESLIDY